MKILIRNLARTTTKEDLESLFKEFGSIQSCNLVVDRDSGKSKGFAFVEMPKPGEAKAAIKNLNSKIVGGVAIRVKRAKEKNV
jgi:RNA recognition motif-containing protein